MSSYAPTSGLAAEPRWGQWKEAVKGGQGRRKTPFASRRADPQRSARLASRGRADVISGQDIPAAPSCETGLAVFTQLQQEGAGGTVALLHPHQLCHLGYLPSFRNVPTSHFTSPPRLSCTPLPINLFSPAPRQPLYNLSPSP